MARTTKAFNDYQTWDDFASKEGQHNYARQSERFIDKPFASLKVEDKLLIKSMANKRASEIFMETIPVYKDHYGGKAAFGESSERPFWKMKWSIEFKKLRPFRGIVSLINFYRMMDSSEDL